MKKRYLILTLCIIIPMLILGAYLGAGNYGYAQKYEFNVKKEALINSIKILKNENLDYKIPENIGLVDSSNSTNKYYQRSAGHRYLCL